MTKFEVNPMNHASVLSFVVPVFPARLRPNFFNFFYDSTGAGGYQPNGYFEFNNTVDTAATQIAISKFDKLMKGSLS